LACSVCREKGHDKRQCPEQREKIKEEITFKRERLNLLFAKTPDLLANPVLMGLLWYSVSRNNALLSSANTLILAGDIVGLNVPEGATLGAIIQKAEKTPEYLKILKGLPTASGVGAETLPSAGIEGLVSDLISWLGLSYKEFEEGLEYKPQL